MEGTVSSGHVRTSPISIFIAFLNRSHQANVVCITIYIQLLIIERETNRQSSTGFNVGPVPWGHSEPGSDADDVPLLLGRKRIFCVASKWDSLISMEHIVSTNFDTKRAVEVLSCKLNRCAPFNCIWSLKPQYTYSWERQTGQKIWVTSSQQFNWGLSNTFYENISDNDLCDPPYEFFGSINYYNR